MNAHDDDRLRTLFDDAVSDVEPRGGLDRIRDRTGSRTRRPWVWGAGGAVLATAATVAAVAMLASGPGTTDAGPGPAPATQPSEPSEPAQTSATEPPGGTPVTVSVYYAGETSRGTLLFKETHQVALDNPALAAARLAVVGAASDPDYRTLWPQGTNVTAVSFDGNGHGDQGTATVALSGDGLTAKPTGTGDGLLALQQLAYTVQDALGARAPLQFTVDGTHADTVLGQPVSQGVETQSADSVQSPVQIDTPADGATVDRTFTVSGRAAAFEANVQWELMQGDTVAEKRFTTAAECCTLSPFSFEVTAPGPGDYTLVVHDEDVSGGEGSGPVKDTKRITVR
jgi:hypothetical protein